MHAILSVFCILDELFTSDVLADRHIWSNLVSGSDINTPGNRNQNDASFHLYPVAVHTHNPNKYKR